MHAGFYASFACHAVLYCTLSTQQSWQRMDFALEDYPRRED